MIWWRVNSGSTTQSSPAAQVAPRHIQCPQMHLHIISVQSCRIVWRVQTTVYRHAGGPNPEQRRDRSLTSAGKTKTAAGQRITAEWRWNVWKTHFRNTHSSSYGGFQMAKWFKIKNQSETNVLSLLSSCSRLLCHDKIKTTFKGRTFAAAAGSGRGRRTRTFYWSKSYNTGIEILTSTICTSTSHAFKMLLLLHVALMFPSL